MNLYRFDDLVNLGWPFTGLSFIFFMIILLS